MLEPLATPLAYVVACVYGAVMGLAARRLKPDRSFFAATLPMFLPAFCIVGAMAVTPEPPAGQYGDLLGPLLASLALPVASFVGWVPFVLLSRGGSRP